MDGYDVKLMRSVYSGPLFRQEVFRLQKDHLENE
jgi:hypothetical protein